MQQRMESGWAGLILLLLTVAMPAASCKRSGGPDTQNSGAANTSARATSRTPPFSTKEPERYQATRVVTSEGAPATQGAAASGNFVVRIARDGERRLEEYQREGSTVAYLQVGNAAYVLLPEEKLYAELSGEDTDTKALPPPPDFSPDRLLNEVRPEAEYEDLGAETINGRATRKYRVTVKGGTGTDKVVIMENLVWVDDALGMPIRTETSSSVGARTIVELRDISQAVNPARFTLPSDYRRVELKNLPRR